MFKQAVGSKWTSLCRLQCKFRFRIYFIVQIPTQEWFVTSRTQQPLVWCLHCSALTIKVIGCTCDRLVDPYSRGRQGINGWVLALDLAYARAGTLIRWVINSARVLTKTKLRVHEELCSPVQTLFFQKLFISLALGPVPWSWCAINRTRSSN